MAQNKADSDTEIANEHAKLSQQLKNITVVPINFDLDPSFEGLTGNEKLIEECCAKVDNLLAKRHPITTLIRDLRKYDAEKLPVYANVPKAVFAPKFGSEEALTFFREKLSQFNKNMKGDFLRFLTEASTELFKNFTQELELTWSNATKEFTSGNHEGGLYLRRLNDRVQGLKEKWTDRYRNDEGGISAIKEEPRTPRETSERKEKSRKSEEEQPKNLENILKELEDLKEMFGDRGRRNSPRGGGGYRGRRGRNFRYY